MAVSGNCNNCVISSNGVFNTSGSTTPIYLEVVNENGQPLSDCVVVTSEVIRTYPEMIDLDDCGCPINECDKASLRINIRKGVPQQLDCGFNGFTLDVGGLVLFDLYDGSQTFKMSSECCTSLGYKPVATKNGYECSWGEGVDQCDGYTLENVSGGVQIFRGPDGLTDLVPNAECCPAGFTPQPNGEGKFNCFEPVTCDGYTPLYVLPDGYVMFEGPNGETTRYVPSFGCCSSFNLGGRFNLNQYDCFVNCGYYESITVDTNGLITFIGPESSFTNMSKAECCPVNSTAVPITGPNGLPQFNCIQQ